MKLSDKLGTGIYTVHEASSYTKVAPGVLRRWLYGDKRGRSVIDPLYGKDDKVVSFLDLIQMLAIREIRIQREVPLSKIRQAIEYSKDKHGIVHPFARKHTTFLYGDELMIRVGHRGAEEYVEASGKHRGQKHFQFVELYMEDLSFDADGLANKFQIFKADGVKPVSVTMDPAIRFGEPMLPSGYSASAIWNAIRTEGGLREAADAYGIDVPEAEAAYRFVVNYLGKSAA
jgi:hypothetical protein